jgi:hypothetical protein
MKRNVQITAGVIIWIAAVASAAVWLLLSALLPAVSGVGALVLAREMALSINRLSAKERPLCWTVAFSLMGLGALIGGVVDWSLIQTEPGLTPIFVLPPVAFVGGFIVGHGLSRQTSEVSR